MKYPPFPRNFVIAAAAFLAAAASVWAAPVPTPAPGSLILGIRSASTGSSYLVNLGIDTTYRNAARGTSFNVSGLGNIAADLALEFGVGWPSDPDISWGIFGERSAGFVTTYGSKQSTAPSQASIPYSAQDPGARASTSSDISGVLYQPGGYSGREAAGNSPVSTFQPNNGAVNSYAYQVGDGPADFGSLSGWASIEARSSSGISPTVLNLYRFSGTASTNSVTNIGSFTISTTGVIRFTAPSAAAPTDSDDDGFTDAQEVYAGTDPNNASSFFKVAGITLTPTGQPRVKSTTAANRSYVVQYTPDLLTAWVNIFSHSSGAGAVPLDFIESDAGRLAPGKGFYRVKIQ